MSNRPEPLIPLSAAEMLFVVLDTARQSGQLDDRTKENVRLILATYRARVKAAITGRGYDDVDINHYTSAAAEALANWLDDRANKAEAEDLVLDFVEFEKDFTGEQQAQDQDQGTSPRGGEAVGSEDGAGGTHPALPPGDGRDADSGPTDPGIPPTG